MCSPAYLAGRGPLVEGVCHGLPLGRGRGAVGVEDVVVVGQRVGGRGQARAKELGLALQPCVGSGLRGQWREAPEWKRGAGVGCNSGSYV